MPRSIPQRIKQVVSLKKKLFSIALVSGIAPITLAVVTKVDIALVTPILLIALGVIVYFGLKLVDKDIKLAMA